MTRHSHITATATRPATEPTSQQEIGFEKLNGLVKSGCVSTVLLAVPDMQGRLKGKQIDAGHFLNRVVTDGAEMCAYILATDVDMRPLDGFALASWATGFGDMSLRPDLSAVHHLAWEPQCALVYADAVGDDGLPVEVSPRQMLRHQIDQLKALGITAQVGLETELVLYHGTYADAERSGYRELQPLTSGSQDYALDHTRLLAAFFRRLERSLARTALPVEAIKSEGVPGQVEVTFPYGDPMAAADKHLLFKHAARVIGEDIGVAPTFMAAPATGGGSGCHIHLSLVRDDRPLFAETEGRMPDAARHVIAGLLDVLPDLALLYAPTINSYKRFSRGAFAPTNFTWGRDNRTCAVRVVGRGDSLHLEVRLAGADANPYLALAAVLAAARHGLDHTLDPPHPSVGDAYQQTKIPSVAGSLEEAHTAFLYSTLPAHLLQPKVAQHYDNAARHEITADRQTVTPLELHRGFATA